MGYNVFYVEQEKEQSISIGDIISSGEMDHLEVVYQNGSLDYSGNSHGCGPL